MSNVKHQSAPYDPDAAKDLFIRCVEAPDSNACEAILQGVDPGLATRVRRLLASVDRGEVIENVFGAVPAIDIDATADADSNDPRSNSGASGFVFAESVGTQIENYKLLEQIGEGGMGTVFMAQQTKPIKRRVAVKVVKPGMDSRQVVARFEAERQALALMDHPNIARVFDGGTTPSGRPYFVMELVKGIPLTEFCQSKNVPLRERLRLFIDLCRGVQHAHQRGIIHRDLKPSNVLVTLHDGDPVIKIIDFGIAKAMNSELTDKTLFTQFAAMVGTPLYMSPEQAELSGLDVDTRSDVYSLGVLLYELLTDVTPFDRETLKRKGIDEVRRMIRETEPPRPSQRLSTVKASDGETINLEKLRDNKKAMSMLSGELDWIVMQALEKDRDRRYQSAAEFADDIQRHLDGQAVQACPPSSIYRLKKFAGRHKASLATSALILVALSVGMVLAMIQAIRARVAEENAARERNAAVMNLDAAMDAIQRLLFHVGNTQLADIPKAQGVREDILRDTLAFYQDFQERTGTSPSEVRFQVAIAKQQLGDLVVDARQWTPGSEILREATEELARLVDEEPDNLAFRRGYANALGRLASSLMNGHYDFSKDETALRNEGVLHYRSQQDEYLELCRRDQENQRRYRLKIVQSKINQAKPHLILKEFDEAAAILEPVWQRLRNQAHRPGTNEFEWFVLSQARLSAALHPSDYERAKRLMIEAVALTEQALAENPRRVMRQDLVQGIIRSSVILNEHDEPVLAMKYAEKAIHHTEALYQDYPTVAEYYHFLDLACSKALNAARKRCQLAEARGDDAEYAAGSEYRDEVLVRMARDYNIHRFPAQEMAGKEDAIERLSEAIEQYPDALEYYYYRGETYKERDQPELALADYEQACRLLEGNPLYPYLYGIVPYRQQGQIYRDRSDFRKAIECFTKQIELGRGRKDYYAYRDRAYAYFEIGDFDACLHDLRRIFFEPQMWHLLPAEKVVSCDDANFQEAYLQLTKEAVEKAENNIKPLANLYWILMLQKKRSEALAALNEASYRGQVHHFSMYTIGLACLAGQDLRKYRQVCREMVEHLEETATVEDRYFTIWTACLADDALEDFSPVLTIAQDLCDDPEVSKSEAFKVLMGQALFRAKSYDEAWEKLSSDFKTPTDLKYSKAYVHYFRAMTAHHLGKVDESRAELELANEMGQRELSDAPNWNRRMTLELLRKEADSLIRSKGKNVL